MTTPQSNFLFAKDGGGCQDEETCQRWSACTDCFDEMRYAKKKKKKQHNDTMSLFEEQLTSCWPATRPRTEEISAGAASLRPEGAPNTHTNTHTCQSWTGPPRLQQSHTKTQHTASHVTLYKSCWGRSSALPSFQQAFKRRCISQVCDLREPRCLVSGSSKIPGLPSVCWCTILRQKDETLNPERVSGPAASLKGWMID